MYICVPRQEAVEILCALWITARFMGKDIGQHSAVRWFTIMEHMIDIADAIDYFDKRHEVTPRAISELVAEGLGRFPPEMVEFCKDS